MRDDSVFILTRPRKDPQVFGSIEAIFDEFTPEEIGLPKYKVWGSVEAGKPLKTDKVTIYKTKVSRRRQRL